MKRSTWICGVAGAGLLGATLVSAPFVSADDKAPAKSAEVASHAPLNTLTDEEKAAGWQLLFDGKSADHFRTYNGDAISPIWKIHDGELEMTGKGGGDLITKEQYENYELSIDYKISKGGNSGLIYHCVETPKQKPYVTGPEIQIQDNVDGHDPQKAGWLYQMYQPPEDPKTGKPIDATKPAGEWNTLRFKIESGKGTVWMNGVKYYDFEMWGPEWQQRLAKTKFTKWENFSKPRKGHICLQDHASQVAFRNIKIRPIATK